jgi:CHASE2 domain-containing sensor protein
MLDRLQLQVSSLLYQTRQSSTPIVIVGVDSQTTQEMGQTATWTRDNYVQAIKNISKYNPAVIGLDYYFTSPSKVIPTSKLTEILSDSQSSADISARLSQLTGTDLNQYDRALSDEIKNNGKLVMIYPTQVDF